MSIKELYEHCGESNKSMMLYLRKDEYYNRLIQETSTLPSNISKSERFYCWLHNITEVPACPFCGKPRRWKDMQTGYFATCGDKECKSAGIAKANREAPRDWDKIQKKMRDTYKEKTGYEHNMQNPEFKEEYFKKYAETHNGEKCGVCSSTAIENRKRTFDEKYAGNIYNALSTGLINKYGSRENFIKIRQINTNKQEQDFETIISRISEMGYTVVSYEDAIKMFRLMCNRCGHEFTVSRQSVNVHYRNKTFEFCPKCDFKNMTFRSHIETDVAKAIKDFYDGEIIYNHKKIFDGYECDIVIPELKIAIEVNGIHWHTEEYKTKNNHIEKKKVVESKGYNLIQIWEDEWRNPVKQEIIISRLMSKFGKTTRIYARKCTVKKVSGSETKRFLDKNHLHGYLPSTYKLGLFYNDELVEMITIGKTRKPISGKTDALELYRLCTKRGYTVIGGLSRLISHFAEEHHGETLYTFCDCDWGKLQDSAYEKAGFKFIKQTEPNYWWAVNDKRENRLKYTKSKLVEAGYNKNKTEVEIMHDLGHWRIFGTGNILYSFEL